MSDATSSPSKATTPNAASSSSVSAVCRGTLPSFRRFVTGVVGVAAATFAFVAHEPTAAAWIDTSIAAVETQVEVGPDGAAVVDNALTLKIKGGPFRSYDIPGFDSDAVPEGEATATPIKDSAETGPAVPVMREILPDGALRLSVDASENLIARGTYLFRFRHRTSQIKLGGLERDGSMVRVRYQGPRWPGALDSAKMTFLLQPGAAEPRPATDRVGDSDGPMAVAGASFLSTVRRKPGKDEIDLIRPHVSRGDQVTWAIRVDPKALPAVTDARVLPLPATMVKTQMQEAPEDRAVLFSIALGVALLFTALMGIKCKQVATACLQMHAEPRALLPFSAGLRVLLVGPLVAGAILLQLFLDSPMFGTFVLVAAMLVMAHRAPLPRAHARGPGRWLPVSEEEAFGATKAPKISSWLDVSTTTGKVVAGLFVALVIGATVGVHRVSPYHAWLLALDAIPFLALFCTGLSSQLPPDAVRSPAKLLAKVKQQLQKQHGDSMRIVPLGRFAQGSAQPDELRLLAMPKTPVRGVSAIEIGVAWSMGEGGALACPEVLVRTVEDSVAAKKLDRVVSSARWVKGRKPGERVFVLEPKLPTWRMTAALTSRLSSMLTEASPARALQNAKARVQALQDVGVSSAASSSGKGASAKKARTVLSPANATEAACSA
jgi:hypothetical protein